MYNWWRCRRDWILRAICGGLGLRRRHQGGWKLFWHHQHPHESFIRCASSSLPNHTTLPLTQCIFSRFYSAQRNSDVNSCLKFQQQHQYNPGQLMQCKDLTQQTDKKSFDKKVLKRRLSVFFWQKRMAPWQAAMALKQKQLNATIVIWRSVPNIPRVPSVPSVFPAYPAYPLSLNVLVLAALLTACSVLHLLSSPLQYTTVQCEPHCTALQYSALFFIFGKRPRSVVH